MGAPTSAGTKVPNWWGAGKAAPVQVATCWGTVE